MLLVGNARKGVISMIKFSGGHSNVRLTEVTDLPATLMFVASSGVAHWVCPDSASSIRQTVDGRAI